MFEIFYPPAPSFRAFLVDGLQSFSHALPVSPAQIGDTVSGPWSVQGAWKQAPDTGGSRGLWSRWMQMCDAAQALSLSIRQPLHTLERPPRPGAGQPEAQP